MNYIISTHIDPFSTHDPDRLTNDWKLVPPQVGREFHFVHQTKSGSWTRIVGNSKLGSLSDIPEFPMSGSGLLLSMLSQCAPLSSISGLMAWLYKGAAL